MLGASIQGLRNPRDAYPTQLFSKDAFDELVEITQEEIGMTIEVMRKLARREGLFVGPSSSAIMYVAFKKAIELGRGKVIVAILPDSGMKYLSMPVFE